MSENRSGLSHSSGSPLAIVQGFAVAVESGLRFVISKAALPSLDNLAEDLGLPFAALSRFTDVTHVGLARRPLVSTHADSSAHDRTRTPSGTEPFSISHAARAAVSNLPSTRT